MTRHEEEARVRFAIECALADMRKGRSEQEALDMGVEAYRDYPAMAEETCTRQVNLEKRIEHSLVFTEAHRTLCEDCYVKEHDEIVQSTHLRTTMEHGKCDSCGGTR